MRRFAIPAASAGSWRSTPRRSAHRSALAERVRLGVHPYEALGLEVEKIAGDWDTVRILRKEFPLATDQQERRVCDGQKVLQAAREGALAAVAGLPASLADDLAPLDEVLDTYADLLVADGVHALVTGRADLANAAMEAAAGLGAPPELRAIRTPRQATTVRVSAWALVPGRVAVRRERRSRARGRPGVCGRCRRRARCRRLRCSQGADRDRRLRFATVLGGADERPPVPTLSGGSYEGLPATADADLRIAIANDLNDTAYRAW